MLTCIQPKSETKQADTPARLYIKLSYNQIDDET